MPTEKRNGAHGVATAASHFGSSTGGSSLSSPVRVPHAMRSATAALISLPIQEEERDGRAHRQNDDSGDEQEPRLFLRFFLRWHDDFGVQERSGIFLRLADR